MQNDRDIRKERMVPAIDHAWRIWEKGKKNLDDYRVRFNAAASYTQNPPKSTNKGS